MKPLSNNGCKSSIRFHCGAKNRAKDKAALNEKLSGKSLGAVEDGGDVDLKTWIKKTKKRERELAAKRKQESESQDKQHQDEYRAGMSLMVQADIRTSRGSDCWSRFR
jgi:hypothetical protein